MTLTIFFAIKVFREYTTRISIYYPFHKSDIKWSLGIVIRYPLYGFFGGMMAGLLGIGGGLILAPLLLDLGIHPLVSTATTNFLVLFTSSSTSLQFLMHGMLNVNYGIVCTACSTIGSYLGTLIIQLVVGLTKRHSMLVFALGTVLAVSTIFIPTYTMLQIIQNGKDLWLLKSAC